MSPDRRSPSEWSKRLAETFVTTGRVTADTAAAVLSEAGVSGRPVAAVLADRGLVERRDVAVRAVADIGGPLGRHLLEPADGRSVPRSCPSCSQES